MATINKHVCPTCGQSVNERQISLFKGMVEALWAVFCWCKDNEKHEFERKEVKHLFRSENITARFGDWVFFGGLVYKKEKAHYGLNMERCEAFFGNTLAIPTMVHKNPLTKEIIKSEERFVKQIPNLSEFLDQNGKYNAIYGRPYTLRIKI